MKALKYICVLALFCFSFGVKAQASKTTNKKNDTTVKKQDNMMDMLSGTLTGVFGENMDGKPKDLNSGIGFLELLEKSGFSQKEKNEYRNWYFVQSKNLTPKQKDSINLMLMQKMEEAESKKSKQ
ncbi:hypothetical protein ACOKFD_11585 [Flagellimonas sp. S174]|uniref:hypothetical protein n=1 Tax=Flagellimonas sp. S174 TaxID=3410790 RepID=UPI003BF542E1